MPRQSDAHRQVIRRHWHLQDGLRANLTDRDSLNQAYQDGSLWTLIREKFEKFYELRELMSSTEAIFDDGICSVFAVPDFEISIVCANTA
jgi:hypothetical protein